MGSDLGRRAGVGSGDGPPALSLGCVRPLSPPRRYGYSLLIYQHFGRQKHDQFVESPAEELARLGNADRVFAFYDDAVAFFLVAQHDHTESLDRAKAKVEDRRHRLHGSPVKTRVFEVPQRRPRAG